MVRLAVDTSKRLPRHLRNEDIPTQTFTPRTYQVELLDAALQHNTIVCLGSASGRTFIAVMLIREMGHQVRQSLENGGRRSIFLVNSESVVDQQSQVLCHHTDLIVGQYTRELISDWSADDWQSELIRHNVLIMTADIFHDIISNKHVRLSQVNVLVCDECHLVTDTDHPYSKIMHIFDKCPNQVKPRILGLTSNILTEHSLHPAALEESVISLEQMLHSIAETSTLVISERYGIRPKEIVLNCELYEDQTGLCEKLGSVLERALQFLLDSNVVIDSDEGDPRHIPKMALSESLNILYKLGPWCSVCIAQLLVTQLEKLDKHESNAMPKKFLKFGATQLRLVIAIFDKKFTPEYAVDELLMYCSPKVGDLFKILRKYKPDYDFMIISEELDAMLNDSDMSDDSDFSESENEDQEDRCKSPKQIHVAVKRQCTELEKKRSSDPLSMDEDKYLCGIIFVEHQYVAYALNKFIEEVCAWDEELCFIKSHHITGQGLRSPGSKKSSRTYKKQEDVLRKFRMQELNLLVSTNVLEEGVDVPKCNLIIRFDLPKDYRSYSHSKGRARAREAQYMLLVEPEQLERFEADLAVYKGIEQILVGRLKDKDDNDSVDSGCRDLVPPYVTSNEDGLKVTLDTAIGIVNRYCAKLPSDAFTHLTPKCAVKTDSSDPQHYTATVQLPINSPIREEVIGLPMSTKSLAKKAAALKMCELLHKSGELDDQLMPVGKEFFMYEEEDKDVEDEDMLGEARPGTTKRKQYYFKKIANAILHSHSISNSVNQLYLIELELTGPITEDQNTRGRRIYAPEETTRCFGILASKSVPQVPQFPIYTRSGEVTVSLLLLNQSLEVLEEDLTRLQQFHKFLFSNVLRLEKDPMDYNPTSALVGCLIVPLNKGIESSDLHIDWNFVQYVESNGTGNRSSIFDPNKEEYVFCKEVLEDAVVMPSYRNIDQPQHFYVAEIRTDLTPLSPFPSPELYKTFSDYYTSKYGLVITNKNQPLLDVDHTSARLNLLTPRYMNQKGVALPTSSAETKKARRENLQQKQILIPELCDIHVFPASLWRKAVCLPTVLYRVNYLLLAEEIRIKIAIETKIGMVALPTGFRFPKFDFGFDTSPDKLKIEAAGDQSIVEKYEEANVLNADDVYFEAQQHIQENNLSGSENERDDDLDSFKSCEEYPENIDEKENCTPEINQKDTVLSKDNTQRSENVSGVPICDDTRNEEKQVMADFIESENCKHKVKHSNSESETSTSDGGDILTKESEKDYEISKKTEIGCDCDIFISSQESSKAAINPDTVNVRKCSATFHDQSITSVSSTSACVTEVYQKCDLSLKNGFVNRNSLNELQKEIPAFCGSESDLNSKDIVAEKRYFCTSSHDSGFASTGNSKVDVESTPGSDAGCLIADHNQKDQCRQKHESSASSLVQNKRAVDSRYDSKKNDMFLKMEPFMGMHPSNIAEINCKVTEIDVFPEPLHSMDDVDLNTYVGPSPCIILQALTMSNANDFFSLERLETIGDSFLKYAITVYLYCTYPGIHEGKLSYLRSKQVSNYNLYRLGKKKNLAECMISTKFEPYENWLPPGYVINESKRKGPVPKVLIANSIISNGIDSICAGEGDSVSLVANRSVNIASLANVQQKKFIEELEEIDQIHKDQNKDQQIDPSQSLNPYSLQTQHSIPDKSIADCVEALIGCYLTSCGKKAALLFMSWLGLKVLPRKEIVITNAIRDISENEFDKLPSPPSPLITYASDAAQTLNHLLDGYDAFETKIGYTFRDRSFLLQAFTHASYHYNTVTDCYQRLEFLGDAILDYVITRHLYEDSRKYSPGVLTDLRSALVNNNIFAALAVKWDFHKFFKAISPSLFHVIEKFVARQKENEDEIDLEDDEDDEEEDHENVELEVPKALGDIFESVAGAIYLDSDMSLDTVWRVYYQIMRPQIEKYLKSIPKSPVRELLEMEPETAKFEKPERTMEGKIRLTVNVVGKGVYTGIGRNYRIAKSAAAKKALRCIKTMQAQGLV